VRTLLVVEDEFAIAEGLKAVLEDAGYRAATAPNGRAALELMRQSRPDAVIVDLMLPVMSGLLMLRAMADDPALRDLPVLVITALATPVARLQIGPDRPLLTKPFRVDAFLEAVAALFPEPAPG